jgi:hypothetical protein
MQRRAFLNVTAVAGAALAFKPLAFAGEQERKSPVVYPDPAVEAIDQRFAKYVVGNAAVERLYTGTRWSEGPVWFGDGRYLLWSDIPNNRIRDGARIPEKSAYSAVPRTSATATTGTGKAICSPASTTRGG